MSRTQYWRHLLMPTPMIPDSVLSRISSLPRSSASLDACCFVICPSKASRRANVSHPSSRPDDTLGVSGDVDGGSDSTTTLLPRDTMKNTATMAAITTTVAAHTHMRRDNTSFKAAPSPFRQASVRSILLPKVRGKVAAESRQGQWYNATAPIRHQTPRPERCRLIPLPQVNPEVPVTRTVSLIIRKLTVEVRPNPPASQTARSGLFDRFGTGIHHLARMRDRTVAPYGPAYRRHA